MLFFVDCFSKYLHCASLRVSLPPLFQYILCLCVEFANKLAVMYFGISVELIFWVLYWNYASGGCDGRTSGGIWVSVPMGWDQQGSVQSHWPWCHLLGCWLWWTRHLPLIHWQSWHLQMVHMTVKAMVQTHPLITNHLGLGRHFGTTGTRDPKLNR
jgi:hypothetical protein